MNLGLVYQDGFLINHRSLVKVLLNPILRYFGYELYSIGEDNKIINLINIHKCDKQNFIKWVKYKLQKDMKLVKKRRII